MLEYKNLIYVSSYCFPNNNNPQLGRYVLDQCIELKKRGLNIVVLNVKRSRKLDNSITIRDIEGITVVETGIFALGLSFFPALTVKRYDLIYKKLYDFAKNSFGKPRKMYIHFSFPIGFSLMELCKKENISIVVMEHHSLFLKENIPQYIRNKLKELINSSDYFLVVSEALKQSIINKINVTNKPIIVVHNIINDIFAFSPRIPKNSFAFFAAGNLVKDKRFDILIKSCAILKNKGVNFSLRIAGDGIERRNLARLIDSYDLSDRVELLGRLSKEYMQEEYARSDCFVLPSKKETYGIVYREALIVGRPVISSNNGGIFEDWEDKFGIILDKTNEENLSDAMIKMIRDYDNYDLDYLSKKNTSICSSDIICDKLSKYLGR